MNNIAVYCIIMMRLDIVMIGTTFLRLYELIILLTEKKNRLFEFSSITDNDKPSMSQSAI